MPSKAGPVPVSCAMPEAICRSRISAIGAAAAEALCMTSGRTAPLPDFPDAPYRLAGTEIVWLGQTGPMHPRAVFVDAALADTALADTVLSFASIRPWTAPVVRLAARDAEAFGRSLAALLPALAAAAPASGVAPLLRGQAPGFPLAARHVACLQLARSARSGDADMFVQAASRLLGAGIGLTPSGDDFVGAALFTLRAIDPDNPRWRAAAVELVQCARVRSHAIGAALFSDLAHGKSFAAVHALFMAQPDDARAFAQAACALGAIGHSSGWDMLAGIVAAGAGRADFSAA